MNEIVAPHFTGGSLVGRRLAFIHTGTKLAGAVVVLLVLGPVATLLSSTRLEPAVPFATPPSPALRDKAEFSVK